MIAVLCALFIGCKQESGATSDVTTPESEVETEIPRTPVDPSTLEVDAPDKDPAPWTFLTADLFHYTMIDEINEKIDRAEYIGRWINLKDDWTYEGGYLEESTTAGTWEYDHDSKILDIKPVDVTKRSQWRLLHRNDKVVLAGTSLYGDNARQMRWERFPERPSRVD